MCSAAAPCRFPRSVARAAAAAFSAARLFFPRRPRSGLARVGSGLTFAVSGSGRAAAQGRGRGSGCPLSRLACFHVPDPVLCREQGDAAVHRLSRQRQKHSRVSRSDVKRYPTPNCRLLGPRLDAARNCCSENQTSWPPARLGGSRKRGPIIAPSCIDRSEQWKLHAKWTPCWMLRV